MKCIGFVQRSGEFNGRPWKNVILHCLITDPKQAPNGEVVQGEFVKEVKVPYRIFDVLYQTPSAYVGQEFEPVYNQHGYVVDLRLL